MMPLTGTPAALVVLCAMLVPLGAGAHTQEPQDHYLLCDTSNTPCVAEDRTNDPACAESTHGANATGLYVIRGPNIFVTLRGYEQCTNSPQLDAPTSSRGVRAKVEASSLGIDIVEVDVWWMESNLTYETGGTQNYTLLLIDLGVVEEHVQVGWSQNQFNERAPECSMTLVESCPHRPAPASS